MNAAYMPPNSNTAEPLYDVLTESGEVLAMDLTLDAAHQLAGEHQASADCPAYREISIRSVRIRHQSERQAASRYQLPEPPEVGPPPALVYGGGTLGLEDASKVTIQARAPAGLVSLTLEQALRYIDHFAEPGRSRILLVLPYHFDMPGGAA